MNPFERLGLFYLGKVYDRGYEDLTDNYLLYDSKDLVTHAVCVGMTGSGKTGLCIGLLEEAAIDNIPAIIIDPKGDLTNLMLTFPQLRGSDFLPWVNSGDARKKGLSVEDYAKQQAKLWRDGLRSWGQDGERVRRFKSATETTIYTPGSTAGVPISILQSFNAPPLEMLQDMDLLRDRVQGVTSGLLHFLGIKADPIRSREHILIANLLEDAWLRGEDLDIPALIQRIQNPTLQKIGVFDIESFFPQADRFKLAMTLNNILAAPSFKTWLEGEPMAVDTLLHTADGQPRLSIFSIAHLSDPQRMFFVTLLLNQILGWMRTQSGTTSLRAVLYIDELFGFLPPVAEPPSKKPLLTLLKQARAYGLGVVLATQNPVDLDYKGLSNTGTWFIGRLQTENDKKRLIEGLTKASETGPDKKFLSDLISSLKKRAFLLHSVHMPEPVVFGTRWVLSYLRGPMTRVQITQLMKTAKARLAKSTVTAQKKAKAGLKTQQGAEPLQLSPEIKQYFAPIIKVPQNSDGTVYQPYLVAGGEVQIINNRLGIAERQTLGHWIALDHGLADLGWDMAETISIKPEMLTADPEPDATYLQLPAIAAQTAVHNRMDKAYENFVYRSFQIVLHKSTLFKQTSKPGETEGAFRIRLDQLTREERDLKVERLQRKYARRIDSLQRQLLTAEQRLERESDQYKQRKVSTAISFGTTLLGALLGRKAASIGTLGRASTAAKSASRMGKEKQDIARATEKVASLNERLDELQNRVEQECAALADSLDPAAEEFQSIVVRPKKTDVLQKWFGILWVPMGRGGENLSYDFQDGES